MNKRTWRIRSRDTSAKRRVRKRYDRMLYGRIAKMIKSRFNKDMLILNGIVRIVAIAIIFYCVTWMLQSEFVRYLVKTYLMD